MQNIITTLYNIILGIEFITLISENEMLQLLNVSFL